MCMTEYMKEQAARTLADVGAEVDFLAYAIGEVLKIEMRAVVLAHGSGLVTLMLNVRRELQAHQTAAARVYNELIAIQDRAKEVGA